MKTKNTLLAAVPAFILMAGFVYFWINPITDQQAIKYGSLFAFFCLLWFLIYPLIRYK